MSASGGFGLLAGFFGQQQAPPGKTLYNTLHEFMFWVFLFTIVGALGESPSMLHRMGWRGRKQEEGRGAQVFGERGSYLRASEGRCRLSLQGLGT
jgi:hypothetical protein